jgi:hypothetical protein
MLKQRDEHQPSIRSNTCFGVADPPRATIASNHTGAMIHLSPDILAFSNSIIRPGGRMTDFLRGFPK